VPAQSAAPSEKGARENGLVSKLGSWLGRSRNGKKAIPQFVRPPVQGELSLDLIKVVRNDLSDTDLEIVRAQAPKVEAVAEPVTEAAKECVVAVNS